MPTLTIILDTNEYIFGLTGKNRASTQVLKILPRYTVKLPRIILHELHNNLADELLKSCYRVILESNIEIVDKRVSRSILDQYASQLPPEDAVIAAYCSFLQVDYLISENRHFLVGFEPKSFKILSAENFIKHTKHKK